MGRWAQRRRRATPPDAAPTVGVVITDVQLTGSNSVDVNFSDSVVATDVGTWAGFNVNGQLPNSIIGTTGPTVSLGFSEQVNDGDPWATTAQPDWLETPLAGLQTGTVMV